MEDAVMHFHRWFYDKSMFLGATERWCRKCGKHQISYQDRLGWFNW